MLKRFHHADEREFRCAIIEHVAKSEETCAAHHAHYMTVIAAQHGGQKLFEHPVAGEQIHAHHRYELVFFALHERLERVDARVIHQNSHITNIASHTIAHVTYFFSAPKKRQHKTKENKCLQRDKVAEIQNDRWCFKFLTFYYFIIEENQGA